MYLHDDDWDECVRALTPEEEAQQKKEAAERKAWAAKQDAFIAESFPTREWVFKLTHIRWVVNQPFKGRATLEGLQVEAWLDGKMVMDRFLSPRSWQCHSSNDRPSGPYLGKIIFREEVKSHSKNLPRTGFITSGSSLDKDHVRLYEDRMDCLKEIERLEEALQEASNQFAKDHNMWHVADIKYVDEPFVPRSHKKFRHNFRRGQPK